MSYLSTHKLPAGHAMTGHFMQNLPVVNAIEGLVRQTKRTAAWPPINQNKAFSYDRCFIITEGFILILRMLYEQVIGGVTYLKEQNNLLILLYMF